MTNIPPARGSRERAADLGELGGRARRGTSLPPRHLADLDLAGRRAVAAELGEKEFRATQLSQHYFGRLVRDPVQMTDVPAAARDRLAAELMPSCSRPYGS